jgi:hypothetical protein
VPQGDGETLLPRPALPGAAGPVASGLGVAAAWRAHFVAMLACPASRRALGVAVGAAVAQNLVFSNAVLYYGRQFIGRTGLGHAARTTCVLSCGAADCPGLRCAVLCCAVLCCAVLCCAVLCCAVLCCAVLCCAVL